MYWTIPVVVFGVLCVGYCVREYFRKPTVSRNLLALLLQHQQKISRLVTELSQQVAASDLNSAELVFATAMTLSSLHERLCVVMLCAEDTKYIRFFGNTFPKTARYWDHLFHVAEVTYRGSSFEDLAQLMSGIRMEYAKFNMEFEKCK